MALGPGPRSSSRGTRVFGDAEWWRGLAQRAVLGRRLGDEELGRRRDAEHRQLPDIRDFAGTQHLRAAVMRRRQPWGRRDVVPSTVPGMLTAEERRYYEWIAGFYSGVGAAVEIGPWLGHSTHHIVRGLLANPRFAGRLHVIDDFVWQSYMDAYLPAPSALREGDSFLPSFRRHTASIARHLEVSARQVMPKAGNEQLERLSWSAGPIEMCWIDCGKTFEVNEAWFRALSPSFVADRTLVIMQDWQAHKDAADAATWGIRAFTDAQPRLQLVHELLAGGTATFLYR